MKVLVVDDSPAAAELLRAYLVQWGYEQVIADSAPQAWDILEAESDIGLVLCDWEMPEMTGPDLCRRIRRNDLGRYVYVILFTGRTEGADLVVGLEAGADDFVRKPLIPEEVRARVRAGQRILALEANLEARNAALRESHARISRDLAAAARLQHSLLPPAEAEIGHTHVTTVQAASHYVAGDVYNYLRLGPHHVGFYVIDVAGHGVQAALLSVALNRWLTSDRLVDADGTPRRPAEVLDDLNRRFLVTDDDTPYFTMVYGILNESTDLLEVVVAGQPQPLLLDGRGGWRAISDGGFPVGLLPDAQWNSTIVPMRRYEDRLVIYTDGLLDLFQSTATPEAVAGLVHAAPSAAQLTEKLCAVHSQDGAEIDDMSIMIISNRRGRECTP